MKEEGNKGRDYEKVLYFYFETIQISGYVQFLLLLLLLLLFK